MGRWGKRGKGKKRLKASGRLHDLMRYYFAADRCFRGLDGTHAAIWELPPSLPRVDVHAD